MTSLENAALCTPTDAAWAHEPTVVPPSDGPRDSEVFFAWDRQSHVLQVSLVDVQGDQIIKVRGDREHPLSKGYTCPKGRATGQIHHQDGAIDQPLMRKGGALVPVRSSG